MAWMTRQLEQTIKVSSTAFGAGEAIPRKHTCQGADVSPPLAIGGFPEGTKTWALIMDDPDAPAKTWLHWTAWDLPRDQKKLPEGVDVGGLGGREGRTDFGDVGYGGPCPPSGKHRYFFRVFALDDEIDLSAGAALEDLRQAINDHALAYGELMGTYAKT